MNESIQIIGRPQAGSPNPLGASFDGEGTNFALYSQNATGVDLCLFDFDGRESHRIPLAERTDDIWHAYVPGIRPGHRYGYRVQGPYAPEQGHRFNPNKLLIDPYAKQVESPPRPDFRLYGYRTESPGRFQMSTSDSARQIPKSVVVARDLEPFRYPRPNRSLTETVIYEAHVRGATMMRADVPEHQRGLFAGLASDEMLAHLTDLGVTAVELLPVQAHFDERFLTDSGLVNYWGYNTIAYFALDPRFAGGDPIAEFRRMVDRFHGAGLEVILDVVFNHSGEGNQFGPTMAFRGIDNSQYYRLWPERLDLYVDDTGTGNSLDVESPCVIQLILDALRYWAGPMGVDGFRFDLAATLGRTGDGFDPNHPLFAEMGRDPLLQKRKLIAEPWDVGPGGYQLGAFPKPFAEWNDAFRDTARRFWRCDTGASAEFATRFAGSADLFDKNGRAATTSVNFVTAHDGFTLSDLVAYARKHNEANAEENRDGHSDNHSVNHGAEGPTKDPEILAARRQHRRNLLATVMLAQGVPMILAGDEAGNSQSGNNNAYCQDNEIGWIDWTGDELEFLDFVKRLIALRRGQAVLGQDQFLHAKLRPADGLPDILWFLPDGTHPKEAWEDPGLWAFGVAIRGAADGPEDRSPSGAVMIAINNSAGSTRFTLPPNRTGQAWYPALDTGRPNGAPYAISAFEHFDEIDVAPYAILVLIEDTKDN